MRKIMVLIMSLMVGSAFAASTHLSLDNWTGTRVAAATEQIRFSPAWETDAAGATAVVSVNGEVVKSATAAGVYEWTPTQDGTYELTHAVYANGVQVGETLTATFVAGGIVPRSCDWTTGTMELGWFADAQDLNPCLPTASIGRRAQILRVALAILIVLLERGSLLRARSAYKN